MTRCKGDAMSPRCYVLLLLVLQVIARSSAGPVGPLPNITSSSLDMGLKEGSCALGDVVYLPGDEFPGSSPCERCACTERGVQCKQQQCEPRPGCKALHRPDHCCPTYQCECEQEGRVYGNGEKLVDPADPCRVCYCQGGEVVCRRIACFTRDDCTPRLVPGRCCPEYDNCPLRGVTSLPIMTSSAPVSTAELIESSIVPAVPKEIVKQEITIKEITPVSEIPIITDVKIKEILPSPTMDVAEYSSSKSPLIPREATSEMTNKVDVEPTKPEPEVASPSVIEIHPSPETISLEVIKVTEENKAVDDAPPSKISLSTQDSINSEIYPSNVPLLATASSSVTADVQSVARTTKAPMIEEEDPLLFDHNPAFPPLPDDLSVLSNHGDELVPEPSADTEHVPEMTPKIAPAPEVIVASISPATVNVVNKQLTTTSKYLPETSVPTEKPLETSSVSTTLKIETTSSQAVSKEFPVINLRSAIPTEIVRFSPQAAATTSQAATETSTSTQTSPTTDTEPSTTKTTQGQFIESTMETTTEKVSFTSTYPPPEIEYTTLPNKETEIISTETSPNTAQEQTTSSIAKFNVPTEVTSQTELSSLPIETSDQNPHDVAENVSKDTLEILTVDPLTTVDKISPSSAEVITVAKSADTGTMENIETTEFILNSFGSSESATDAVELIKIAGDSTEAQNHEAIIDSNTDRNKNALSDLFKLVSDVASISDHTDASALVPALALLNPTSSPSISESEELIPVNAGYKSKTNYNQNSITEVPVKSKSVTPLAKQKVVEIEDEDSDDITDSPPPNDKVEPTTRRPIIDNVSDDKPEKKTDKKDIEIITQSYVPTINRRPTKVVLLQEKPREDAPVVSVETATEASEVVTRTSLELSSSTEDHGTESTLSLEQ